MQFKQVNWFALVGGILVLVVLSVSIYFPWWQLIIGDEELAQIIDSIDKTAPDEPLCQKLAEVVQNRISELQLIGT